MPYFFRLFCFLLLGLSSTTFAQIKPLIESRELLPLLEQAQTQTIDIRAPEAYAAGHIPNAISAPYGRWRGPANSPGQLADTATFAALVQELGLNYDQQLVVYSTGEDETDFGASARVYWTLKYLGFSQISVLNGGYKYWQALQEHPISQTKHTPQTSQVKIKLQPQLAILKDEMLDRISQQSGNFQLLDSRPPAFFNGQVKAPMATTPGTIAGAQNAPFQQWFNAGDTRIRSVDEIKKLVQQQGLDQAQETLSFCNTGHWAATNWFVLSELAQLPNVRLYPASMAEWTQSKTALPMDNAPTRLDQITAKLQQLVK